MESRLYRDEDNAVLGGVCAGLANYFNIDVTLVRVVMVILGFSIPVYFILWIVIPGRRGYVKAGFGYAASTQPPFAPHEPLKRRPSNASVIFGMLLISIGGYFLLDEYGLIPDFDISRLWPVIFIIAGAAIIFRSDKVRHHGADPAPWVNKDTTEKPRNNDNPATV